MMQYLPELNLLILAILAGAARFENQRWARARIRGLKGSSKAFGEFVDWTCILGTIFTYAFLAAYFFDYGWQHTLMLVGILFFSGLLIGFLMRGDKIIVWIISTFALWPLMLLLARKVSWFGIFSNV